MTQRDLEDRIQDRGRQFFATIGDERPSLFNKSAWTGKLMDACMRNERFKVQLFRFIDVLPYLTTTDSFSRRLDEYFGGEESLPAVLKWGLRGGYDARPIRRRDAEWAGHPVDVADPFAGAGPPLER